MPVISFNDFWSFLVIVWDVFSSFLYIVIGGSIALFAICVAMMSVVVIPVTIFKALKFEWVSPTIDWLRNLRKKSFHKER